MKYVYSQDCVHFAVTVEVVVVDNVAGSDLLYCNSDPH